MNAISSIENQGDVVSHSLANADGRLPVWKSLDDIEKEHFEFRKNRQAYVASAMTWPEIEQWYRDHGCFALLENFDEIKYTVDPVWLSLKLREFEPNWHM